MTARQLRDFGEEREQRIADALRGFAERNSLRSQEGYLEMTTQVEVAEPVATLPDKPIKPARRYWFTRAS
jgi:hypothetical protein